MYKQSVGVIQLSYTSIWTFILDNMDKSEMLCHYYLSENIAILNIGQITLKMLKTL